MKQVRIAALSLLLLLLAGCRQDGLEVELQGVETAPPAGVRVQFSVRAVDGEPVGPLDPEAFAIINDATGQPFDSEGGGAPFLGTPTEQTFYTVLLLDMSDSIVNNGADDDVIAAARTVVDTLLGPDTPGRHQIAIYAFGSSSRSTVWAGFTASAGDLNTRLDELLADGSRGGTNLYGAYLAALELARQPPQAGLTERSVVLVTDGTHEAGDLEAMRRQALDSLQLGGVDVYAVGMKGDYDEERIRELASADRLFFRDVEVDGLTTALAQIADRVRALASSNYVLGVCSPVEAGDPSITIQVTIDERTGELVVPYPVGGPGWTGDVSRCDPAEVADGGSTDTTPDPDPLPVTTSLLDRDDLPDLRVRALAADRERLYVLSGLPGLDGTLLAMAADGSDLTFVADFSDPVALAVGDGELFVSSMDGSIHAVDTDGGPPRLLAQVQPPATSLAVFGENALLLGATSDPQQPVGTISIMSTGGGPVTPVMTGLYAPRNLVGRDGGDHFYWLTGGWAFGGPGAIMRSDVETIETIATAALPTGLAVEAGTVYWTDVGFDPELGAPAGGVVRSVASSGGTPQDLAEGLFTTIAVRNGIPWLASAPAPDGRSRLLELAAGQLRERAAAGSPIVGILPGTRGAYWAIAGDFTGSGSAVLRTSY